MKKIIGFLLICILSGGIAHAQGNMTSENEVMMKMLSLKNALVKKDSVTLSQVLADDVTYGHTNGLIQSKPELIRSVISGEQDYKSIDPSEMKVRIYDNTAVVTIMLHVKMNYQSSPLDMNMRATLVWIKMKEEWKLVARQSVKTS